MKKLIISGLWFLCCAAVLYVGLFAVLYHVDNKTGTPLIYSANEYLQWVGGDSYQRLREFDLDEEYDVIVLGSSHAYRGYDPRIFEAHGSKAFVLGSSAQSLDVTLLLAEHYLEDYDGLILVDCYFGLFEASNFEPTMDLMSNAPDPSLSAKIGWNSNDIRCINAMLLRIFHGDREPLYLDEHYVSGGFVWKADSIQERPEFEKIGLEFDPKDEQVEAYHALINWLETNNKRYALVSHPLPLSTQREDYTGANELFIEGLNGKSGSYFDYTFDHDLHDLHHFFDYNHLNSAGVAYFNERLIRDLTAAGLLPES